MGNLPLVSKLGPVYDLLPIWLIALGFALLIFLTSEAACWAAKKNKVAPAEIPFDVALAPAFTLVALLLGFAFSMALGRYEMRGRLVIQEANSLRRLIWLTDALEPETARSLSAQLQDYVQARADFAGADAEPQRRKLARERSAGLQQQMWQVALAASKRDSGSTILPLVLSTLSEVLSVSAEQDAAFADYIPPAVVLMLVFISVLSAGLMGFRLGCQGGSGALAGGMLAFMLALILGTIIDLDQPQRGFIRVSLEPLGGLTQDAERVAAKTR